MLPASVLYGGQEGLKPLSFKMCAFQGEKTLTNRLLFEDTENKAWIFSGSPCMNRDFKIQYIQEFILFEEGQRV